MVTAEIKHGKIMKASLVNDRIKIEPENPMPIDFLQKLEKFERELEPYYNTGVAAKLGNLRNLCSEHEKAFIATVLKDIEGATITDVINRYKELDLEEHGGRTLAGVTSGLTRKLKRLGIEDFYKKDYDSRRNERRWMITIEYREQAKKIFLE